MQEMVCDGVSHAEPASAGGAAFSQKSVTEEPQQPDSNPSRLYCLPHLLSTLKLCLTTCLKLYKDHALVAL